MIITNYRLYENKQKAESILKKYRVPTDDKDFQKLRTEILGNGENKRKPTPNYLGQFTKWLIQDKTNMDILLELIKLLSKDNIKLDRPIDTFEQAEDLYDYIQNFEINQSVNKVVNALTPNVRKLITDNFKNLIKLNIEHADDIIKFFKKSKRYDPNGRENLGINRMYTDTEAFINNLKGDFSAKSLIKRYIESGINILDGEPTAEQMKEGNNIMIVVESPFALIVDVFDYKASCTIGSKSWCIATSESQWNSYVNDLTKQYFIFDFTKSRSEKEHAIGVTVGPDLGNEPSEYVAKHWADDTTAGLTTEYIDELIEMNS